VRLKNRNVTKFEINKIYVFTNINADDRYIYNLSPQLHQYDAATKRYVDGVAKNATLD